MYFLKVKKEVRCPLLQMHLSVPLTAAVSVVGGLVTYSVIPKFRDMFVKVGSWFSLLVSFSPMVNIVKDSRCFPPGIIVFW